ncbi:MAG: UDP-N-acetyl glucosamine 2-epimerase [bacterium]|nr:UDP-N-acetyl glucosamine 2-epimerase [bacterium]
MKIAHIVGARPQFIKCAPLLRSFHKYHGVLKSVLIHTGQHYDYLMSEIFFRELGVVAPDYHLGVGSSSQGQQTGQIMEKTEKVLRRIKPAACLVYGDTNSTLGGALAAAKLRIPVIHVEAGLRSYDKRMPEEINRVLTDHLSTLLLCPTENAVSNLKKEGFNQIINEGRLLGLKNSSLKQTLDLNQPQVANVGDVMFDALLFASGLAEKRSSIIARSGLWAKRYAVLTIHRAENADDLEKLEQLLRFAVKAAAGLPLVFPVHPRTAKNLKTLKSKYAYAIRFTDPLGYFDMLKLVHHSALVFTDSGGLQKEAFWLGVRCVTLREQTEWIETIRGGNNVLYRAYRKKHHWPTNQLAYYGDGQAAERIAKIVASYVKRRKK